MSNLLELAFKIENTGLHVWTYPNEDFIIFYLQWILIKENLRTATTNFEYVFRVASEKNEQTSQFSLEVYKLEKVNIKTRTRVLVESISLDSIISTKETKVPFSIVLVAFGEEAEKSLRKVQKNHNKFECDDLPVEDGWFKCCLWGERRKTCSALWDISIIGQWKQIKPKDKDSFDEVTMVFSSDGKLIYSIDTEHRTQTINLVYETTGGTLVTNQPSAPRKEYTEYYFESADLLVLIYEGEKTKFHRIKY